MVFLPDFNVKNGQRVYPAADLSEQISTAGKEASGTGNMKFAMNGALTIGTLDGANVEIREAVGPENFFLFGLTAGEVDRSGRRRATGRATSMSRTPSCARRSTPSAAGSSPMAIAICSGRSSTRCSTRDDYMLLADYQAYVDCQQRASEAYRDQPDWTRMSILNCARVGRFSSDRSIRDYCRDIWHIDPMTSRCSVDGRDRATAPPSVSAHGAIDARDTRARALRSAPPSVRAASTSACSRKSADARSSCCCSTTPTRRSRRGSIPLDAERASHVSLLARLRARTSGRDRSTPTAPTDRSRRSAGSGSMATKVLLDPYGRAVAVPDAYDRGAATRPGDNAATAMKSVVADPGALRLGRRCAARRPFAETIIYELHVARLHAASELRASRPEARDLRRA